MLAAEATVLASETIAQGQRRRERKAGCVRERHRDCAARKGLPKSDSAPNVGAKRTGKSGKQNETGGGMKASCPFSVPPPFPVSHAISLSFTLHSFLSFHLHRPLSLPLRSLLPFPVYNLFTFSYAAFSHFCYAASLPFSYACLLYTSDAADD